MSPRRLLSLTTVMFGVFAIAGSARAGLESVTVNHAAGTATFTLDFPQTPNFYTRDLSNRPDNSFIIEIAKPAGTNTFTYSNLTSIVRGDEISIGNTLPIRNASPAVSAPSAGGWGSVRGAVPFTVSGDTLTFTAPLQTLGAPSGVFAYRAVTTHYGAPTSTSQGASVPLPPALVVGLLMLVGMMVLHAVAAMLSKNG